MTTTTRLTILSDGDWLGTGKVDKLDRIRIRILCRQSLHAISKDLRTQF